MSPRRAALLSADTFAGYALALDFKRGRYRHGNVFTRGLSSLPGYSFSDNVDNLPNIDGNGYTALIAETSKLSLGPPVTADTSFIAWVVATLAPNGGIGQTLFDLTDGTNANRFFIQRGSTGTAAVDLTSNSVAVLKTIAGSWADGRCVLMMRRAGGNLSICAKAPDGTLTIGTAGAVTGPLGTMASVKIGMTISNTGYANSPIEFVGMKLGTFSDAEITALLLAA